MEQVSSRTMHASASSSGKSIRRAEYGYDARQLLHVSHYAIATKGVGSGSGPWMDGVDDLVEGGAVRQSMPGSCVSACGEMLGGASEAQILGRLGEWSTPGALASELGPGWRSAFVDGADALTLANRGPIGAVLQAPGGARHMVVTSPLGGGRFLVRDPWGGVSYTVGSDWIETFVSAAVYR
jgi:hypothetical protein